MYSEKDTETKPTTENLIIDKINNPFLVLLSCKNFMKANYF